MSDSAPDDLLAKAGASFDESVRAILRGTVESRIRCEVDKAVSDLQARIAQLQGTENDLRMELENRGRLLLELEADAEQAKKAVEHIAELLSMVSRERDQLKQWKSEHLQVTTWWDAVDDYVRKHPGARLGYNVSAEALRLLQSRDELAKGILTALSYPRGSEAQVRCLEEIGSGIESPFRGYY